MAVQYQAKGFLIGTAPVKKVGNKVVIGDQPVRFSLKELITAQDTKALFAIQYYDAAAWYFRRLSQLAPVSVQYVEVKEPNRSASCWPRPARRARRLWVFASPHGRNTGRSAIGSPNRSTIAPSCFTRGCTPMLRSCSSFIRSR